MPATTLSYIMPLLSAIVAALVALLVSWLSRKNDMRKLIEENLRKRKIELYDEFAKFLGEGIFNTIYKQRDEKEFEKQMFIFNHRAMMWMSDDVLKAYMIYRNATHSIADVDKLNPAVVMAAYFMFIQEMRKDCGHKNIGIEPEKLIKLLIRDKVEE